MTAINEGTSTPVRRVLLTGAAGFVGSYVFRGLLSRDDIEAAALLRTTTKTWRIDDLLEHPRCTRITGDLANLRDAEPAIAGFAPDTVVHLAWSGVGNRHRDQVDQVDNLAQALEFVRLAARVGAKTWVGLGSQAEYGPTHGPLREDAPTRPTTLYGASKLACGELAGRVCAVLGLRFGWLRLFSAYGPRDDPAWMIPSLILRLLDRERPALTAGEQIWDYLFVADAAEAIIRAALMEQGHGVYNLGSGQTATIRRIVERIRDAIDPALPLGFGEVPYRPDQVMHLEADVSRLRDDLEWSPAVGLAQGMAQTVEWFREHRPN